MKEKIRHMLLEFHMNDDEGTRNRKLEAWSFWYEYYEYLSKAKDIPDLDIKKQELYDVITQDAEKAEDAGTPVNAVKKEYDRKKYSIDYFYNRIKKQFDRGFDADTDGDVRGLITKFVHEYRNK